MMKTTGLSDALNARVAVGLTWSLAHLSDEHDEAYRQSLRRIFRLGERDELRNVSSVTDRRNGATW